MIAPLLLSLKLAAAATLALIALGLPLAALLAFGRFRGKAWLEALIALPLVLPPTVLGYYVLLLLAPDGWLGRGWQALFDASLAFSFAGMLVASVLYSLPFAVQPMAQAMRALPARWLELGQAQGLQGWRLFRQVIWPGARAGVLAGGALAFAHTMGEFGAVLMVGGSIPGETRVASIALFEMVELGRDHEAALLALILLGMSLALLALVHRFGGAGLAAGGR